MGDKFGLPGGLEIARQPGEETQRGEAANIVVFRSAKKRLFAERKATLFGEVFAARQETARFYRSVKAKNYGLYDSRMDKRPPGEKTSEFSARGRKRRSR